MVLNMLIDNLKDSLTTKQISQILGVSKSTVRSMIRDGLLAAILIAGRYRVLKSDLEAYLQNNLRNGAGRVDQ